MIYVKLKFDRICVQMQSVLVLASSFRRADASHLHLLHSRTMMNHPRSSKIIQDHPSIFTTGGSWSWSCSLPVSASIQSSNAKEQSNSRCGIGLQICTFPSRPPHAYRRACDACGPQLSQQNVQSPAFVPAPLTSCNCKSRCGSHRSHLMFPHLFNALTLDHAFQESLHTGYNIYIYVMTAPAGAKSAAMLIFARPSPSQARESLANRSCIATHVEVLHAVGRKMQ